MTERGTRRHVDIHVEPQLMSAGSVIALSKLRGINKTHGLLQQLNKIAERESIRLYLNISLHLCDNTFNTHRLHVRDKILT